jgi:hypothetical protein
MGPDTSSMMVQPMEECDGPWMHKALLATLRAQCHHFALRIPARSASIDNRSWA